MVGNGFLVGNNMIRVGEVNANDTIVCDFFFINQGTEPVKIIEHTVSCGCTGLRYNSNDILAGDTVVITMLTNTKGKIAGNHSSVAVLETNGKRRFYDITAYYTVVCE